MRARRDGLLPLFAAGADGRLSVGCSRSPNTGSKQGRLLQPHLLICEIWYTRLSLSDLDLVADFQWHIAKLGTKDPNAWLFPQDTDKSKPMWDSGVRKALKQAAADEKVDFPGFGLHSLRRANITWRQKHGGASSIEASKLATRVWKARMMSGHATPRHHGPAVA